MQRPLLMIAAAAAWALLPMPATAAAAPRNVTIVIDKMKFAAVPAEIHNGDVVIWDNRDMFRHSATAKGVFDVDLPAGKAVRMKVTAAGTFAFTCKYHPGMKGVLKVVQ